MQNYTINQFNNEVEKLLNSINCFSHSHIYGDNKHTVYCFKNCYILFHSKIIEIRQVKNDTTEITDIDYYFNYNNYEYHLTYDKKTGLRTWKYDFDFNCIEIKVKSFMNIFKQYVIATKMKADLLKEVGVVD